MYINFRKARFSCYALGKIMGLDRIEKLSKQELKHLEQLSLNKNRTEVENEYLKTLQKQKKSSEGTLSQTCISYLREELFIYNKLFNLVC